MINNIHVLQLQSVGNIRDLGGFQAGNGKQIKYGKFFVLHIYIIYLKQTKLHYRNWELIK